jgi:hypothetical protein
LILIPQVIQPIAKAITDNMFLVDIVEGGCLFNPYWVVFDNNSKVPIGDIVRILNTLRNKKIVDKRRSIRITHPSYSGKNNFYVMYPS